MNKKQLEQQVTISKTKLDALEKMANRVIELELRMQALTRKVYGSSSEGRAALDTNQLSLFETAQKAPETEPEEQTITYKRKKASK